MTLHEITHPTDQEIAGWIVRAGALGSLSHKAGALTAARENLGPKGFSLMLRKTKLETAEDVVEWLRK